MGQEPPEDQGLQPLSLAGGLQPKTQAPAQQLLDSQTASWLFNLTFLK